LVEHILKDAQFLLSNKYYVQGSSKNYSSDKQKVKAIVIACNTATAYGKAYVEEFLKHTGINLKVIGVIDAGAQGTLDIFSKDESGSIGVFATVGTIASKGYENTILALKDKLGYTGNLQIYNQGGYGLAEAVDEEPDFISRKATMSRANYRGPMLDSGAYKIEKTLLEVYKFDFSSHKMLCDSKTDECGNMQLNSADNYARYHLVSLMEKIRKTPGAQPLKALVLGCTHYPFLISDIRKILGDLYNYQKNGDFIYRPFMNKDVKIIDPAVNVAAELYTYLKNQHLFNPSGNMSASEFFISVPNTANKNVVTDEQGRFTYGYKYGRNAGEIQEYVKVVPFSRNNIPSETIDRIKTVIPATYTLIQQFHSGNPKLATLPEKEKIKE
jgi:glutamate racemase